MKRITGICMAALLALGTAAFAACGDENGTGGGLGGGPGGGLDGPVPEEPVSPLAALDVIDMETAFGDTEAEDWSFAFTAAAEMAASYELSCTSEVSGKERLYSALETAVSLADTLGVRSSDKNPLGFDLFGGGTAGLALTYTGPASDSAPVEKNFEAGIRHDGDLVRYAGEGGKEEQISLSELGDMAAEAAQNEVYSHLIEAAKTIPEQLEKGFSLRVGVEKLIDLGFSVEIDDAEGLAVRIVAERAFFTDLLNDALEAFLPTDWWTYLPRADFSYEITDFALTLAFDGNGLFKEYSVASDVRLGIRLEQRGLFVCTGSVGVGGTFSVNAYTGEVPGFGGDIDVPEGEEGEEGSGGAESSSGETGGEEGEESSGGETGGAEGEESGAEDIAAKFYEPVQHDI